MKTSSAKAKGRSFQKWVSDKISETIGIKNGKDELIDSRPMGNSGTDIILIGKAKELFPYSVECKKHEKWNMMQFIEQAKTNSVDDNWLLFISKNRFKPVVVMDAEKFFELQKKLINT